MAQNGNAVISMRVRTLCTQRHSLASHPRRHGGGGQGEGGRGREERGRETEWLQFALMSSKCSNTGDFIEACIWASLMRACTPQTYVETDEETDRQTFRQADTGDPRESERPCAL